MMSEPGVMGTPLAMAVARAVALSPIIEITLAEGPMKVMPEDSQISAKRAFSERKPVAGMDGIGAGDLGGGDDAVHFQIGLLAGGRADADRLVGELDMHRIDIRLGIDGDGFHIELAAGADDAEGDFAAIGDQDALEHAEDRGLRIVDCGSSLDAEENVAVLHGVSVFGDDGADGAGFLRLDFVHDLHRLDDADGLADGNGGADLDEIRGVRVRVCGRRCRPSAR
jgi:hypothetical protein